MIAPHVSTAPSREKGHLFGRRIEQLGDPTDREGEYVQVTVGTVTADRPDSPTIVLLMDADSGAKGLSPAAARAIANALLEAATIDEHQREEADLPQLVRVTPSQARELLGQDWRAKLARLQGASP